MSDKEKATVMQLLSVAIKSNDSSSISYTNINDQHTTRKLSSEFWKKNATTKITYICDNVGELYINGNLEYTQYWHAWSTQHSFNPSAGCLL